MQDDVTFKNLFFPLDLPLLVYGQGRPGHVCPRMFSATPLGWEALDQVMDGVTKVCVAWTPLVEACGRLLNETTHRWGARDASV
jgi:hypothetical protein